MMKDKIYLNGSEKVFDEFREIQKLQFELDKHKKIVRELLHKVRSLGQKIPEKIRRLKL